MNISHNKLVNQKNIGFTIVELLVVIVVIGILAAITLVSYRGITARANETVLTSDLANAKKQLSLYFTEYNTYPTTDGLNAGTNWCPTAPKADTNYCLKPSTGNEFTYYGSSNNFTLSAKKGTQATVITNESSPKTLSLAQPPTCPSGFIPVPGSETYGTDGFCVMKYEAKNAGSNVPVSTAAGAPWVSISQTNAIAYSPNVAGCTGCHLITEAEWMTLAQNVLSVPSNWSGNAVGSGFIYSGHNDNAPASALVASTNDNDGYSGTGQTTGSNQRRTLTLTNGQVIWDLAGNVAEWTSGQITGNQPGIATAGFAWRQWNTLTVPGSLAVNPTPTGTGLAGANTWSSAQGIGQLYSNTGDAALRGFLRGGYWDGTSNAGVLSLHLPHAPGNVGAGVGFRVAAPAP